RDLLLGRRPEPARSPRDDEQPPHLARLARGLVHPRPVVARELVGATRRHVSHFLEGLHGEAHAAAHHTREPLAVPHDKRPGRPRPPAPRAQPARAALPRWPPARPPSPRPATR